MRVEPFDFELPQRLIAQHPLAPRDAARLLAVGEALADRQVGDLPELLRPGDLLVFNDTRVLPARLRGRRGEAAIEVTLLQPETAPSSGVWRALARPARKCHLGNRLQFGEDFAAEVIGRGEHGEIVLDFGCAESTLFERLQRHGRMPLPPYIKRSSDGDPRD
ncbi:MAG: S-adenosylmethionine:tRNA ribosyltransferase-isomerase, partial [Nitrospirota bacterium]|nr:S-adenosylmethionine:tRNA ribosyltransferase-isomerase [Nitrospirota bacterium]